MTMMVRWVASLPRSVWFAAMVLAAVCPAALGAEDAARLVAQSGAPGGLVVHVGCGQGEQTAAMRLGPAFRVLGLDQDAANVAAARRRLLEQGRYGPISVDRWDGRRLPLADNLANVVIAAEPGEADQTELLRVLTPGGALWTKTADGRWRKTVKPWPQGMDQWTHYFHDADGNPVCDDALVGPPKRLQWLGGPLWSRHHDHMASLNALVSAGGRIFYILDEGSRASIQMPARWRLIARDAFNGVILWKRDIPQWATHQYPLKSGPAHLLRRLVAVGGRVYVTLGIDAPVSELDAATGRTLQTYAGTEHTREIVWRDGVLYLVADTKPSRLPSFRRNGVTYVWANTRRANPEFGWHGDERLVLAWDAAKGRQLWRRRLPVAPCSLAVSNRLAVVHDGRRLVALDAKTGETAWEGAEAPVELPVPTNTGPRVALYQNVVLLAPNDGTISGWDAKTGRKLWQAKQKPSGHNSLRDLLVVDGLVWTGDVAVSADSGTFTGYDPLTGRKVREFPADVRVHWFHHRCYPMKGAPHYLLASRNGVEFVDLTAEHWMPNHWVRGGCIYGVMPCNGLLYAPMDSCGCQLEAKLEGLKALAPGPVAQPTAADLAGDARLEKGPAYGQVSGPPADEGDWPTYRGDARRSGASATTVSSDRLGAVWETPLGGRLTPPTIAAGKVFVASRDRHGVFALDADTGRLLWSYLVGGPVDSPPTYDDGLVLFGSTDGYVYALRAEDGQLAWRFRAAPLDRRIMNFQQLESAWPVHGAVLVRNGVLYCTAGRNMYLDGGVRFLRLDVRTGRLLGETVLDDKDPESGQDMHLAYLTKTPGNTMPPANTDILSFDGRHIWMLSQKFDLEGNRLEIPLLDAANQPPEDAHLYCEVGFLDDSYFFRSYWLYGRRTQGGYGGWFRAGRFVPSGRILCVDDEHVYGFGRKPEFMVNASVVEYQLFAANKTVDPEAIDQVRKGERAMNQVRPDRNASSSDWRVRWLFSQEQLTAARYAWRLDQPAMIARAMTIAGDSLFVAGPPDVIDERQAFYFPDDPKIQELLKVQEQALDGLRGGQLWVLNKRDGQLTARCALDTIPVFDGLAAAQGRLLMSTVDGRVVCLQGGAAAPLPAVQGAPTHMRWPKPEDPGYIKPAAAGS